MPFSYIYGKQCISRYLGEVEDYSAAGKTHLYQRVKNQKGHGI